MSSLGVCVNYYAPQDVRIEPMTAIPQAGDGEVLVKVEACAICGSDMKTYFNGNPRMTPGAAMGHEFCGEIIEVGKGVTNYKAGQRVTMATTIGCGECIYCRKGKSNLCRSAQAMGFHVPGAMAPYTRVPAKAVKLGHLIDVGNLDAKVASLSEPMSCAMNDCTRPPREEIENVVIIGLGPLGMLHAVCVREMGIKDIVCVEFLPKRMEMARQMGFKTVLTPDELDAQYKDLTNGEGFDLVIVTAPHNGAQSKSPMYARKGGYVSFFASLPVGSEMLTINSRTIHYNELIVYGTSDSTPKHVQEAVKLLSANPDGFKPLITHVLPMSEFHKGIEAMKSGDAVKVVLVP